jgi:two-component system chemotaxis response regulator CheB
VATPSISDKAAHAEARPVSSPQLVTIAASAGGLEAIREVLRRLPPDFGAAIAIVLHRGLEGPDRLISLLARWTSLEVRHAQDGVPLRAGVVYVCPPGAHMIAEHCVRLVEGPRLRFVRPSADLMLESMARAYGDRAIAVVLSGAGADGAAGSLAISKAGGHVIAQDSQSCAFNSMPSAVLRMGATETELPPYAIAAALEKLVSPTSQSGSSAASPDSNIGRSNTRVLLVDDHQIVLDGLHVLIEGECDMEVVGRADNGQLALRQAFETAPDVIVMDICMPDMDGVLATRQIIASAPSIRVVALSSRSDAATVNRVLDAGAKGYLTKHRAFGELVDAVRSVKRNHPYFSRDVAGLVAGRFAQAT